MTNLRPQRFGTDMQRPAASKALAGVVWNNTDTGESFVCDGTSWKPAHGTLNMLAGSNAPYPVTVREWLTPTKLPSFPDTGAMTLNSDKDVEQIQRSTGSFITDGFQVGQLVVVSGFANAGVNVTAPITAVTAGELTLAANITHDEIGTGDERVTAAPTGTGLDAAWSPDGRFLAIAHSITPFITIYERSGNAFTRLANPASLPASTGFGVSWSPDGRFLSVAHATSPYITVYERVGGTFTAISGANIGVTTHTVKPNATKAAGSFSADGGDGQHWGNLADVASYPTTPDVTDYVDATGSTTAMSVELATTTLAAGQSCSSARLAAYFLYPGSSANHATATVKLKKSDGTVLATCAGTAAASSYWIAATYTGALTQGDIDGLYVELTEPSAAKVIRVAAVEVTLTLVALPTGTGLKAAWSPDGRFLSVGHSVSPYITIYERSGTTFTKLADPASLPPDGGLEPSWSPDGRFLVVAHPDSPYITIYERSGTTFTKLADPASLPTGQSNGAAWSPDGRFLVLSHYVSPYITIYERSGTTFTKLTDPASLPTGTGFWASWSPDGRFLSVGHGTSPYITIYERSGTTFTKLADPASLPADSVSGLAFSPDGRFLAGAVNSAPFVAIYETTGITPDGPARPIQVHP